MSGLIGNLSRIFTPSEKIILGKKRIFLQIWELGYK